MCVSCTMHAQSETCIHTRVYHTHTHMYTYTCVSHTHIRVSYMYTYKCVSHTHTHVYLDMCITHTHTCMICIRSTQSTIHVYTHMHTHTYSYINTHTHTYSYINTHIWIHTYILASARSERTPSVSIEHLLSVQVPQWVHGCGPKALPAHRKVAPARSGGTPSLLATWPRGLAAFRYSS